ncbi:MAG: DNA alkylation repair protein [Ruminiclostridium sp.]|nr:DNA alkylation repair protein [Ruminiclostridium sp.]
MDRISKEIQNRLLEMQDTEYGDFNAKIIPNIPRESIIGVRSPELKKLVAEYKGRDMSGFLAALPHKYIEESYIHAQLINAMKDFDECMRETERFLPFIDNWETCDSLAPKVFKKNKPVLLQKSAQWRGSDHTYTIRFGIGVLMRYFLDDDFAVEYAEAAASVISEEYYVNMMIAWYFATALAKHYDEVLPFIEKHRLGKWTHNKTIQKAVESYRVSDEHKTYLSTLKIA